MSEWYEKPYPQGSAVGPSKLKRPLYVGDAGDDVIAFKRAISRGGRWPWATFDDVFSKGFSDGKSGNVGETGVAGFQRQMGINATGDIGDGTYQKIRTSKIPTGLPNAGAALLDQTAINLLNGYTPPPVSSGKQSVRERIVEFCEKGLANASKWNYTQSRPVKVDVDPSGYVNSDCSGSVIQAYYYAKKKSGLAVIDPAKQSFSGYGNTDLYEDDHPTVTGSYEIGDLGHYNGHVTMCMKAGSWDSSDWWSFGSEPPSKRKLNYRTDFRKVVRPPML